MKITWSPKAFKDLLHITEIIALDKKKAALKWAESVRKKVTRLKKFPRSGRVVPELKREEIREIIIGNYRVIYKLGKEVAILTVFHGAHQMAPLTAEVVDED